MPNKKKKYLKPDDISGLTLWYDATYKKNDGWRVGGKTKMNKFLDILAMVVMLISCVVLFVFAWLAFMSGDIFLQIYAVIASWFLYFFSWASVRLDGMK